MYGHHVIEGGFLSDAWPNRSVYVFPFHGGFFVELERFLSEPNLAARPLYAAYLVALNAAFGSHMGLWLMWLCATSVFMSFSLYLLLRKLDFAFLDAGLISGLVLIFPAASSLRFWAATVQIPVAVTLAIMGFLLALEAFDAKGKKRLVLHGASLALFVSSLLFYEAALPLMLASILLYRQHVSWSQALPKWIADIAILVFVTILVAGSAHNAKEVQGIGGMWNHAGAIYNQVWSFLATIVLPFGGAGWYVLALVALLPLAAVLVVVRGDRDDPTGIALRRWLSILAGGIVVVAFGYAVFIPGIDFYTPLGPGNLNRINAVPSIGWVLVFYALLMLAATLAFRSTPESRHLVATFAVLGCVFVGAGWIGEVSRYSDAYIEAYRENERVLATIKAAIPKPKPESTIWTFGQPIEVIPGVPVFGNTWDMTASVQLQYEDPNLNSYVAFPGMTFDCRDNAAVPGNNPSYPSTDPPGASQYSSPYGRTYFVDTSTGRVTLIQTREDCLRAASSFRFGPVLSGEAPPNPPTPGDTGLEA